MERRKLNQSYTSDSFTNFAASLGYGASNVSSGAGYNLNPITRNHTLLEWAYRGSWLVKQVVDAPADDMTREGISIDSDMSPDDIDKMMETWDQLLIWTRINQTIKWGRLYGGCLAAIMIDGQRPETPLRIDTIGKDQFKGLIVLDRWMLWPHLEDPVTELGQDYGLPKFYEVVSDAKSTPHMKIHHSRVIRVEGVELPYWQRIAENLWGLSVLEPLYDRLVAFDSTSQGAAQLAYRAHLRTLKIENLRELIAFGGEGYQAILKQIGMIRLMQTNEALTVLDSTDEFETHAYQFAGLADLMIQFAQQLSGAAGIPLVRLFGQSPAGLNATGDSDIRNYYDFLHSQQEARMRLPITKLLAVLHRSVFGKPLPDGFDFQFNPLWQMTAEQKAKVASDVTMAIAKAQEDGIINNVIAMKELRQLSKTTGIYSNITDEDIEEAEKLPPLGDLMGQAMGMGGLPGQPGLGPGAPGAAKPGQGLPGAPGAQPPGAARPQPSEAAERNRRAGAHFQTREDVRKHFVGDTLPEGMAAVTGPHDDSQVVWLVEQNEPDGGFGQFKVMVGFTDRDSALASLDPKTIGAVRRMSLHSMQQIIAEWNSPPKHTNGGSHVADMHAE
jgi:uncharacterized protein